ncbi:NUDIX domain-containing protein [Streptomyces sp. MJP52]|uniref:nucleotide triphosphate diphosphatase NUDT15 n=1 Tax=Streptomyces sp. MJP52 TaxID=2940555 RepID=UPI0024730887|nr:NUDIX domain-containing protein [Streptomyces sp. MJP52]MDH6223787.1 8-oxo-dGTP diphosphatase [Streptomyces sp. MJP52]
MTSSSMPSRPPVVGVGAVLLRPDGRVLLGHRVKRGEPASWCLPGGHLEPGESCEAAAVREIAEESGIHEVRDARVFAFALDDVADRVHLTAGVLVRTVSDAPAASLTEPDVFARWIWVPPAELPASLFPASAALIAAWRGTPAPDGWTLYPASGAVVPAGGR